MTRYRYWISVGASLVLAVIFISAGIGKLMGQNAFLLTVSTTIMSPQLAAFITAWLPWGELALGAALLLWVTPQLAGGLSALMVGAFIFHNSWMITHGFGYKPCGCLGVFDKIFQGKLSTTGSLFIDIGMIVLALGIYLGYPGKFLDIHPWYLPRHRAAVLVPKANGSGQTPADGLPPAGGEGKVI